MPGHRPIVYVHGITANVDFWPLTLPAELIEYGGCSVSLPDHSTGFSRQEPDSPAATNRERKGDDAGNSAPWVTPSDLSEPIIRIIDEIYEGQPVRLVGWSTGGLAVLHAAATHPEKVESVASICGFARGQWRGGLGLLQLMATGMLRGWLLKQALRLAQLRPQLFDSFMLAICSNRWDSEVRRLAKASGLSAGMKFHELSDLIRTMGCIRSWNITSLLPAIQCPTLIMSGERDPVVPFDEAKHLASTIRDSFSLVMKNCGHLYFAEASGESSECLIRWLTRD